MKVLLCFIVFGLLPALSFSQSESSIDLNQVHQKKVRKYVISNAIDKMRDFSLIHPSWKKDVRESDYRMIEKTFSLKASSANVWNGYRHANSVGMWSGHSVKFGLLISKFSNTVTYDSNNTFPEIDTGQVYFLDLRLLKGLLNLPVAFEIININPEDHTIEFSYLENNKSQGKQIIRIIDQGNGRTSIVHKTYFKSASAFRDDLYPFFHRRFIMEFHRNMNRSIKRTLQAKT